MASLLFNWSNPNTQPVTFNLYENGVQVVSDIGQLSFSLLMDGRPEGEYSYYVTAYDPSTKLESVPSETVTVNFIVPASPTGLSVGWED